MKLTLQNILFPDREEYTDYQELFFKSGQGIYDRDNKTLLFARYARCDFATYLNSLSYYKWKKYANVDKIMLELNVKGSFEIVVSGYHRVENSYLRKTLLIKKFDCQENDNILLEIPNSKETLIGFEIKTYTECQFYGGCYWTEIEEDQLNDVCLSVATTTFKKEDFIRKNVQMIKEEILSKDDITAKGVYLHVVDNDEGRVLTREEIEGEHVYYHPNKNVGGSGGFARGMIESIKQERKATHVLVMDDDIIVLSESIRRTFALLLLVKDKYKQRIISGAMLCYEQMDVFHEDVGFLGDDGGQNPSKSHGTIVDMADMLEKEEAKTKKPDSYAGWWYCCIPVSMIEQKGLPLPLFIRVDDTEFSFRNNAEFITMNGICVWHMGFTMKFNYFMEYYQVFRNFLIEEACNPSNRRRRIISRFKGLFLSEILRFNYDGAEMIVDAVHDYLKGPSFIEIENCTERLQEKSAKNAKMKDLSEFENLEIDIDSVYRADLRRLKETIIYRLTFNGQVLWPKKWLRKGPAVVAHDWFYNPQRQALVDSVISVNPYMATAEFRPMDKKRFTKVVRYYLRTMRDYKKNHKRIDQEYYERKKYLVSYKFWKKYLELDKYQ